MLVDRTVEVEENRTLKKKMSKMNRKKEGMHSIINMNEKYESGFTPNQMVTAILMEEQTQNTPKTTTKVSKIETHIWWPPKRFLPGEKSTSP